MFLLVKISRAPSGAQLTDAVSDCGGGSLNREQAALLAPPAVDWLA